MAISLLLSRHGAWLQWCAEIRLLTPLWPTTIYSVEANDCVQPNQRTNQKNWGRSASRRPSVCLAIPALTLSLGSVPYTLNYNWDYAYANDFPSRLKNPTWEHVTSNAHRIYTPARFERWACLTSKLSVSASISCVVCFTQVYPAVCSFHMPVRYLTSIFVK